MMAGTLHRVSTLLTQVGLPQTPETAGKGAWRAGWRGALPGVDERRLFAADVTTRTGVDEQLEVKARAQDVLAEQTGSLGLFDRTAQVGRGIDVLAAQKM